MLRQSRYLSVLQLILTALLLLSACSTQPGNGQGSLPTATSAVPSPTAKSTHASTTTATSVPRVAQTLPPGSPLPSEATCAARVQRTSWEPRPANSTANSSVPTAAQIASLSPWGPAIGMDSRADTLRKQITGNFTGTTDEIFQWVACKWGFDPDILRADAVIESFWQQSQRGDYTGDQQYCMPGTWDGSGCFQSYGVFQIKWYYFKDAFPMARANTAFNAEFVFGILRACYEGWTTYLKEGSPLPGYPPYHAGDIWGCLGRWYSGWWYTQGAVNYIAQVKAALAEKTWLSPNF